jgi:hypothetical protein
LVTARSMPRFRSIGFMPAATRGHAFANDRLGEHGGGGGAVTGLVVGLAGDFAQHLRAHVLELVLEFDFLGDGNAVLGDARRAEALVDHHVAALGAQRDLHGIGEDIDTGENAFARVAAETLRPWQPFQFLRIGLRAAMAPRKWPAVPDQVDSADDAEDVAFLHDQQVFAVDLDFGARPLAEQHAVAGLDVERGNLAVFGAQPEPTATISPSAGFSLALSG